MAWNWLKSCSKAMKDKYQLPVGKYKDPKEIINSKLDWHNMGFSLSSVYICFSPKITMIPPYDDKILEQKWRGLSPDRTGNNITFCIKATSYKPDPNTNYKKSVDSNLHLFSTLNKNQILGPNRNDSILIINRL